MPEFLSIRPQQVEAFKRDAERRKLEKFCDLLPGLYPGLCLSLGDQGVRRWVSKGYRKSREYGLVKMDSIQRYIHIMFQLVSDDFDANPETAWAGTILRWKNAPEGLKLAALEKRARMEAEKKT
jgi:hypothetical protein